jgi:hypothetical protein
MIIQGTTPTVSFTFTDIDVNELTVCYLTMTQDNLVIEKTLEEAEIGENVLTWRLTQAETLSIDADKQLRLQLRYRIGTMAYASKIFSETAYKVLKEGEI